MKLRCVVAYNQSDEKLIFAKCIASAVVIAASTFVYCNVATALPFNQDMVGNQPVAGSIMRPKAIGSVPRGSLGRYSEKPEDLTKALQITNPTKADADSLANGQRLFTVNCTPCHGSYPEGKHIVSPLQVPNGGMPAPVLADALIAQKSDGHFYQFIHFGGMAIMPAYGYKLSVQEHWDIINYIRDFQRKAAATPK